MRRAWTRTHLDVIARGIECAERYWGQYGLGHTADVEAVVVGTDATPCGKDNKMSTGCWDPTDKVIYIAMGNRDYDDVVGSVAHEFSHAMWEPLRQFDPTHGVD